MKVEKTLLTCSIPEFLSQTMIVKGILDEWLEVTQFIEKLRYTPEYDDEATDEEKKAVRRKAFGEHLNAALNSALVDHPNLTAKLLCAMCFIPETDIDQYKPVDLFAPIKDMIADEELRNFFMSFMKNRQVG